MKIFMTGATGFVGTYLAGRLIKEGYKVTILTPSLTGTERKTDGLSYLIGGYRFGDLRHGDGLLLRRYHVEPLVIECRCTVTIPEWRDM